MDLQPTVAINFVCQKAPPFSIRVLETQLHDLYGYRFEWTDGGGWGWTNMHIEGDCDGFATRDEAVMGAVSNELLLSIPNDSIYSREEFPL